MEETPIGQQKCGQRETVTRSLKTQLKEVGQLGRMIEKLTERETPGDTRAGNEKRRRTKTRNPGGGDETRKTGDRREKRELRRSSLAGEPLLDGQGLGVSDRETEHSTMARTDKDQPSGQKVR